MSGLPPWLADPILRPVWERILGRFEKAGLVAEGRVVVAAETREVRHALGALLGRTVTSASVQVDLAVLDARLRERSGIGGLAAVLEVLFAIAPADRQAARAAYDDARERPLLLAVELVTRPWAADWVAGLRRTGLLTNRPDAERTVREAVTVLQSLTEGGIGLRSRVELGARLLGDAHALDRDRLLHQIVLRGLAAASRVALPDGARAREQLWAAYGVEPDLVSRTCLVFGLRLVSTSSRVAQRIELAARAGDPVHLTEWDLRRLDGFAVTAGTRVLVCENPRVVEAVAERGVEGWVLVCTSGEPNLVVNEVIDRLADCGAELRYHGDFDWAGLAIADRVVARSGARPWRMSAHDYLGAVRPDGPPLVGPPVEPSWDPELGAAMRSHGRAVHEESVLSDLVDDLAGHAGQRE